MKLFIDTCNWKLIMILKDQDKIIDHLIIKDTKKVSDIAIKTINQFLEKNNLRLNQIKHFYLTKGPGSYTGVRVGLTIVRTIKTLYSDVNVYLINSLLFQAGTAKTISLLDARGNKSYIGIYDNGNSIIDEKLIDKNEMDFIKQEFKEFELIEDADYDYLKNFNELESKFILVKDEEEIKPVYIKNFI